jgi:hypothetical protein
VSPNQLIPSQPYTLSYFITDHTDNNTYYVRAVVYDAQTGEILDTQNLTRQTTNTRLFSKTTQAPGDSSGHGRRIVVVATAYTDSGYTTKSDLYQEQSENYIVIKAGAGLTLGGGGGIDYYIVREIFTEEIAKLIKVLEKIISSILAIEELIKLIPTDRYKLEPLIQSMVELKTLVSQIPLDNSIDLTEVITGLNNTLQAITDKPVTEKTDLTELIDAIEDIKEEINNNHSESVTNIGQHMADLHTILPNLIENQSSKAISKQKFKFTVDQEDEKEVEKPKKKFDISKLLG